jgi:hypothetical protein
MHGDFFLLEQSDRPIRRAAKLPLGDTRGRSETWLRDFLFTHPEALPVAGIDPSFGPLLPLRRELRTEAGPLDIAFINPAGRLTLVECKLWRNPEARRKVVAQVLDHARAIARWSYADLQRQVAMASGRQGNIPFEIAHAAAPTLVEHRFADAVVRTLRSGRFLLLVAGDGIREDVISLTALINRNAALGFSFGLVEVALYDLGEGGIAIQPRVTARTSSSAASSSCRVVRPWSSRIRPCRARSRRRTGRSRLVSQGAKAPGDTDRARRPHGWAQARDDPDGRELRERGRSTGVAEGDAEPACQRPAPAHQARSGRQLAAAVSFTAKPFGLPGGDDGGAGQNKSAGHVRFRALRLVVTGDRGRQRPLAAGAPCRLIPAS